VLAHDPAHRAASLLVVDRFIEVDAGKICADARGNPAQKR
jgi:hypothetical protein